MEEKSRIAADLEEQNRALKEQLENMKKHMELEEERKRREEQGNQFTLLLYSYLLSSSLVGLFAYYYY